MSSSLTITIHLDPALETLTAASVDNRGRQQLEQAGFVRHDATGLHRLRRDTPMSVGRRISTDATRLLTASGYDVLRLYAAEEQQQAVVAGTADGPVLTREPGTIWMHHVASDIQAGHLVVHARRSKADGTTSFLTGYAADGDAAVFITEGGGFFGVTRYEDLDTARADFGLPLEQPVPAPAVRTAAAATRTALATAPALPPDRALPVPAPGSAVRSR
ncbi:MULTISPECIES: hypothetical protein [unclassified Kitasatospora]|uniref:hypothetical protein n=1 Tax=unclassified Kitasatospora TaxID=2633591 RepID=UPI00070FF41D|nr:MULTISPECIES: hypothetical protein [unclassified Kitasatospora]KQV20950.1 hypothetical protein ASC99_20830 [Kitasatospora sp. Root107]KRB60396.1 hypothetical protein ASE03_12350 [Kitasatospora sp. Root187]